LPDQAQKYTVRRVANVLIVDDELNLRKVLSTLLTRDGHDTIAVASGEDAIVSINKQPVDIVITDMRMPGISGLDLLEHVKRTYPGLPVIVITAHGSVDTAVIALKNGAFDYITKPFDKDELKLAVRRAAAVRSASQSRLVDAGDTPGRFRIIGQSPRMQEVFAIIEKVAATPSTVLLTGESGTGKELVASALHENSERKTKPFIKVNCAAIPKDLMESEFFGYEQGAFTGAVSSKPGRFELADGGTLFLDEIGEVPASMQVKLLRALQESEFERVGGVRTIRVDVRVVAATNRDLLKEIENAQFREDLYYRLNVVPVALPALRDRREDIPLLSEFFIDKYNKRLSKNVDRLTPKALEALTAYHWPGNIRELENVIERMLLFSENEVVDFADLPEDVRKAAASAAKGKSDVKLDARASLEQLGDGSASMKDIVRQATVEIEKDLIVKALDETRGNVTRAASLLGISRKGLQNKMKELGLRDPENKA
jgi:two-component system response regulator AtoC